MIHFFPRFSKRAGDTPFGDALRALGVAHRIIGTDVPQAYRTRLQLLLIGYPKLALSALSTAARSLLSRTGPPPDAAVISSDVEVLMFALVRALPFAARPRLVFTPFIYTQRTSSAVNHVRLLYYRFVMRRVSCAVCHSRLEVERYQALFAGCRTEFVFVPWGGYVPAPDEVLARASNQPAVGRLPRVVSAGRSGRDYPALVRATENLSCHTVVICNERPALGGVTASETVEVLTACFGMDCLAQLLVAAVVVVPLRVEDISAGQMVLIQTMALGRPLVVTRTPTICDYLRDGDTALLVPRGDDCALTAAIKHLLDDPVAATKMGRRAQADYHARFSIEAHLRALVQVIESHCGMSQHQSFVASGAG